MHEEKRQVLSARSKLDGIAFQSNKASGLTYQVIIDEKGEIHRLMAPTIITEFADFIDMPIQLGRKFRKTRLVLKLLALAFGIFSIIYWKDFGPMVAVTYFGFMVSPTFWREIEVLSYMNSDENVPLKRFHAAEHMVINAYNKKNGVPTMEEIKKASRFSKNCGSMYATRKIVDLTLLSIAFAFSGVLSIKQYLGLILLLIVFMLLERKFGWLKVFQFLFTDIPTEKELKVAREGIEYFDEMEYQGKLEEVLEERRKVAAKAILSMLTGIFGDVDGIEVEIVEGPFTDEDSEE